MSAGVVVIYWHNGIAVPPLLSPLLSVHSWWDAISSLSLHPIVSVPSLCPPQHFAVLPHVLLKDAVWVRMCVLKWVNCFQGSFSACSHIFFETQCVCLCVSCQVLSLWWIICLLLRGRRQVLSKQASLWTPLSLSESAHIFFLLLWLAPIVLWMCLCVSVGVCLCVHTWRFFFF